ncbi:MAG TPA: polymer-forming cytoskeletal protein [Rhodanobacteraceae bacterium]|nr:polymer-forming cytoskeletal protein [Rhodanobacteraceae bacterium]
MFSNNRKPAAAGPAETTILAAGVYVRGDVHFSGNLHLEGAVEGVISAEDGAQSLFTLSDKGSLKGELKVPNAVINGEVEGDIHCSHKLELAAQARVQGDVHYAVLEMAAGARVNGRLVQQAEAPRQLAGPAASARDAELEPSTAGA